MSSVARPAIGLPSKRISPLIRTMPQSARNVVVLPAPLAPSKVTMLPFVEREVEPVQRLVLAVKGAQPADLEHHRRILRPRSFGLAEIGADHLLVLLHRGRRALGDLPAEIERDDLVGDRHHEAHVMLDEQHA